MKCPECKAASQKSCVEVGPSFSTLMMGHNFYDEEGKYHRHDPNKISTEYACSRGHKWSDSAQNPCPTCGETWQKAATCAP